MRGGRMRAHRAGCRALALAAMLTTVSSGCAGMLGSAPAVRCEGARAPDRWMLQAGGVLQGVVASTRGVPLTGATVRMRRLGAGAAAERETRTASQGAFAIDSVDAGRYAANADAPGYGTWRDTVEVAAAGGTVPRILLCSGRGG